ncbi:receptor-transporting protein 2-like [Cololabis saira]|uniref:receptor-transporting protein 2-like n=1 Tax=Cololabis saira TaxID=129043 RepID=UPI002AD5A283|nr:receptor-transporting protein 2-like [Cololabis saira]
MEPQEWIRIFQEQISRQILNQAHTWHLEFDDNIMGQNPGREQYIRTTRARFRCSKCKRSWPSNRVMVLFHMRLFDGQGTVKVRPFRQNCKRCAEAPMEKPEVDAENIEIIMENLVEKIRIKCYHENLGQKNRKPRSFDVKSPHEPAHCEGCKQGICTRD